MRLFFFLLHRVVFFLFCPRLNLHSWILCRSLPKNSFIGNKFQPPCPSGPVILCCMLHGRTTLNAFFIMLQVNGVFSISSPSSSTIHSLSVSIVKLCVRILVTGALFLCLPFMKSGKSRKKVKRLTQRTMQRSNRPSSTSASGFTSIPPPKRFPFPATEIIMSPSY